MHRRSRTAVNNVVVSKVNLMGTALSQLAKLCRPTIADTVARTRLFSRLDECLQRPVAWVTGQAGAGKTTLASSYIQARDLAPLWYQLDEGDADPAQFFYYLGVAADAVTRKRRTPLPLLLVLDNFQTVPETSALHDLIRIALEEVPEGCSTLILSRLPPPPPLTRLQVSERLCLVDAADLRMDEAESAELIRLRAKSAIDESEVRTLIEQSQGWAADLGLLIDQYEPDLQLPEAVEESEPQIVFDYFASEIFRNMEPDLQAFTIKSAFLPQMEQETVERLTGNQKGARILSDLTRRNFFTTRHTGEQTVYQYHPLFRQFLLNRANHRLESGRTKELKARAAHILAEAGYFEASVDYLLDLGDWDSLVTVIGKAGPMLLSQGRNKTLLTWIEKIPDDILSRYPWLQYWQGVSLQMIDFTGARSALEPAYRGLKKADDSLGQYLAWSEIVQAYWYERIDDRAMDCWWEEFKVLQERHPEIGSTESQEQVSWNVVTNHLVQDEPDAPPDNPAPQSVQAVPRAGYGRESMPIRLPTSFSNTR